MEFFAYSSTALCYDGETNTWTLRDDYDPDLHRVLLTIEDDDGSLDGDYQADEIGTDTSQYASVCDPSGQQLAQGQIYNEEFYAVSLEDQPTVWIERLEIDGNLVGYAVSGALTPGEAYNEVTRNDVFDDGTTNTVPDYESLCSVPCFVAGTMVRTPAGERAVEDLGVGDKVLTRDNGAQPIRWIARRSVGPAEMAAYPTLRPILLSPAWTASGRSLTLSRQHGIVGRRKGGSEEFLVRAGQLERLKGGRVRVAHGLKHVRYTHLLLPRHEILFANGVAAESLYPGQKAVEGLSAHARLSLLALFPRLAIDGVESCYGLPALPYARRNALPCSEADVSAMLWSETGTTA